METLGDKKEPVTNQEFYYCKTCDYNCCKLFNWDRHLNTTKHKKLTSSSQLVTKNEQNEQNEQPKHYTCDNCNKIYNSRNGLWKHKTKCIPVFNKPTTNESEAKELIQFLMKENSEFKQLIIEQNKQMIELAKNSGNNNNNTTNNNFNLNLFLNETCKNAMNIMDFVNQLNVSTNDLEETGRLGFAEGISKIFINGLKQIDINDRPIHCSDFKRETIYIKDQNQWNNAFTTQLRILGRTHMTRKQGFDLTGRKSTPIMQWWQTLRCLRLRRVVVDWIFKDYERSRSSSWCASTLDSPSPGALSELTSFS